MPAQWKQAKTKKIDKIHFLNEIFLFNVVFLFAVKFQNWPFYDWARFLFGCISIGGRIESIGRCRTLCPCWHFVPTTSSLPGGFRSPPEVCKRGFYFKVNYLFCCFCMFAPILNGTSQIIEFKHSIILLSDLYSIILLVLPSVCGVILFRQLTHNQTNG